jgi:hypothetical protein
MTLDQLRADRIMGPRYNQSRVIPCGIDQSLPNFRVLVQPPPLGINDATAERRERHAQV